MMGSVNMPPATPGHEEINALYSLIDIVANEKKYRARLDDLVRARAEAHEAIGKFEDLEAKRVKLEGETDVIRAMLAAHQKRLDEREAAITARETKLQSAVDSHDRAVEAHAAKVEQFEKERARHAAKIEEIERVRKSLAA